MKVVVIYQPNSEHATLTESYIHDLQTQHDGLSVETIDADSPQGINLVEAYDIVAFPAILDTTDDGQVIQFWQGEQLPLMNDVAYYARGE